MVFISKPKLEGLGLDSQIPYTVCGTIQRRVLLSSFKKKQSTINGTQSTLLSHKRMISLIYIYTCSVFLLMARIIGFFKPFCLISFPRPLIQRFDLSGRGVFLLSYSRYLAKPDVCTSSTLVLILSFDETSLLFPFFVVFFPFVLIFFEDIISKVVAAKQMFTTIEGIKPSRGSVLIFLNRLLLVTSTLSQQFLFVLIYEKYRVSYLSHFPQNPINDILYSTFV